jgi:hypothetical protein
MPIYWQEENLVKREDFDLRWYRIGKIEIIASEGNMSRNAIDKWAALIRELIDSVPKEVPMYIVVDLSGPKQGFTPYSSSISRDLLNYLVEQRSATSYIALVLTNNLVMQIISTFMQQLLNRTSYPRRSFTEPKLAVAWLNEQIAINERAKGT